MIFLNQSGDALYSVVLALSQGKAYLIGATPPQTNHPSKPPDLLNISSPDPSSSEHGRIPFEKPGRHRRVSL